MQKLEKIMEEMLGLEKILIPDTMQLMVDIDEVEKIIRKHLSREKAIEIARSSRDNDGWISVEDRLPEKDGFYIATIDGEIMGEDDPVVGLAEYDRGDWYDDEDYTRVIAWRPLPEPYRPERSEE